MNPYNVSIITVCKNSEATIWQTIESVLHQTYRNIEYIIIDGGSTDRTTEIIEEYRIVFEGRLQYISERDHGIYDAMNKGILRATGEIIGIINSDDWYEPEAVERVVKCFKATDAEAVYGEMWLINQKEEREYHTWQSSFPPHPGTFIRREIYQRYGMFETEYRIAADRELLLRFMTAGVHLEHIDAILANFRRTGISNRRILECAEETYEIDLRYLGKCSECSNRDAIEEKYEREKLLYISQSRPEIIREVIGEKNFGLEGVAIFGAGSCGKELLAVFEACSVPVRFFADNDRSKWGLEFQGIKIYSPEMLRDFKGHVIVTVTRYQKEICNQIEGYSNKLLIWSVLSEIRKNSINKYEKLYLKSD